MSYVYLSEHVYFRLLMFTGGFTASWAGVFIEYCQHASAT